MAWIEVHQSLRDHRKILALADALDMPEPHVAGHVMYLWLWALDNAPDGTLPDAERIIEKAAAWVGRPGALVAAMVAARILDRDENGSLHIHDWHEYAGRLIDKRRADAERKRAERQRENVQRTSTGHPRDGAGTVPNRTVPKERTQSLSTAGQPNDASASALPDPSKPKPTGKQSTRQPGDARGAPHRTLADVAPETSDPPPEPPPAKPAINPLWDALVLVLGFAPKTPPERSNWGKAVKDLKEAGATPDEIRARAARYVMRFGRERLTVNAIVTHWSECGEDIPATKKRSAYAPPEPPQFTDTVEDHNPWKTPTRPAPPTRQTAVAAAALRKDDTHVKF